MLNGDIIIARLGLSTLEQTTIDASGAHRRAPLAPHRIARNRVGSAPTGERLPEPEKGDDGHDDPDRNHSEEGRFSRQPEYLDHATPTSA